MERSFNDYPRPSLAVDPAVLTIHSKRLCTILWRRQCEPAKGIWALPGVFVNHGEHLESAVARALLTKLNIELTKTSRPEQLFTWNKSGRDPRGWVVTVAYFVLVPYEQLRQSLYGDATTGLFFANMDENDRDGRANIMDIDGVPVQVAFDHDEILGNVVRRLRERIWHSPTACSLLSDRFTLRDLRLAYEAILGHSLNKDSFRNRVTKTGAIVKHTGLFQQDVHHRPAELFMRVSK